MSRSPTIEVLAVIVVVFLAQSLLQLLADATGLIAGAAGLFALAPPVEVRPWTLVTSVYAHAGVGHLTANAIALVLFGLLVERRTTRPRFHAFFLGVGIVAGLAEIYLGGLLFGGPVAVLGASGAIFGLLGYVLAGNALSEAVFDRFQLSARAQLALFVVVAAAVTIATGRPGVALIAHFTGLVLGLLAGRARLLDVDRRPEGTVVYD